MGSSIVVPDSEPKFDPTGKQKILSCSDIFFYIDVEEMVALYQKSKGKRSPGSILFRNCLIILIHHKLKLPLGNISGLLKCSVGVVQKVLRYQDQFHPNGRPYQSYQIRTYPQQRLQEFIHQILQTEPDCNSAV